jgi:hypothetical protein
MSRLSEDLLIWHNGAPLILTAQDSEFSVWINLTPFEDQQSVGAGVLAGRCDCVLFVKATVVANGRLAGKVIDYSPLRGRLLGLFPKSGKIVSFTKLTIALTGIGRIAGKCNSQTSLTGRLIAHAGTTVKIVNFTKLTGTLSGIGRITGKCNSQTSLTGQRVAHLSTSVRVFNTATLKSTLTGIGSLAGRTDSSSIVVVSVTPPSLAQGHGLVYSSSQLMGRLVGSGKLEGQITDYSFVTGDLVSKDRATGKSVSFTSLRGQLIGIGKLSGRCPNFSYLNGRIVALAPISGSVLNSGFLHAHIVGLFPAYGRVVNFSTLRAQAIVLGSLTGRVVNFTVGTGRMVGFGHMFGQSYSNFWWINLIGSKFAPVTPIVINPALPPSLLDNKDLRPGVEFKRRVRNINWPLESQTSAPGRRFRNVRWPSREPVREVVRFGTPPKTPAPAFRFHSIAPRVVSQASLRGALVDGTEHVELTMTGRGFSHSVVQGRASRFVRRIIGGGKPHGPQPTDNT